MRNDLNAHVLMMGVYYKHNAPGGMAAVIQYYERYIDGLRYIASWKLTNVVERAWFAERAYLQLAWLLASDKQIKIVHLHTADGASFWRKSIYMKLAKRFNKKVIMHIHSSSFKDFYKASSRKEAIVKNLRMADRLIVLSRSWREYFISIGADADKICVLHNITDYPVLADSPRADARTRFLFLGEIGDRKGVFDILRGIAKHKGELEGKVILRIGGNKNEDKLRSAIKSGGLEGIVKFEGWVAGSKKQELLNWTDVFILPSFNEGLPISILEAMSYGCPVISTPVGGIPEVVLDGKNGTIVQPGDDEQIIRAMLAYVQNLDLISQQGEQSRQIVKTYLPDFVMKQLTQIYQDLFNE